MRKIISHLTLGANFAPLIIAPFPLHQKVRNVLHLLILIIVGKTEK